MRVSVLALLLLCLSVPCFAARHHLHSVREVDADATLRLASTPGKATAPSGSNQIIFEGDLALLLSSPGANYAALLMQTGELSGADFRFECDSNAFALGCSATAAGNHLRIYAHLRPYLSCRHDGDDNEAVVNLIYRRTYQACGDITCEVWTLLTH